MDKTKLQTKQKPLPAHVECYKCNQLKIQCFTICTGILNNTNNEKLNVCYMLYKCTVHHVFV